ncbi:unnamed protein product [Effrenium voratum]|nr:unnamed protein product [Effrenium voratum]
MRVAISSETPGLVVMKATLLVLMSWAASGASDMEPLSVARRLQIDAACMSSCPGLDTFSMELANFSQQMASAGENAMDMIGGMFDVMCTHQPAMTCLSTQCTPPAELQSMIPLLDCVCTDCPSFKNLYAGLGSMMTTLLSSMTGAAANMTAVMLAVCPMIGPLECVTSSSACAPVLNQTAGLSGMTVMKDNCTSGGYSTGTNDLATTTTVTESGGQISLAALAVPGIAGIAAMLAVM